MFCSLYSRNNSEVPNFVAIRHFRAKMGEGIVVVVGGGGGGQCDI